MYGPAILVEEGPGVGVEQRAVGVERAVLDGDGDLPVGLVGRELVVLPGRRPRQRRRQARARVEDGVVAGGAAADDEEAGRTGVHVEPGHPQGVVVVPGGRRPTQVGVLEGGEPRTPRRPVVRRRLAGEEVVPGALSGEAVRDVVGGGQVPGLGVAVALVADADGAVGVGDDRHRTRVRARCRRERRALVAAGGAAGRVGPVQGRVDWQQVGQEVAVGVDQVVDPLDPHRPVVGASIVNDGALCNNSPRLLCGRRPRHTPTPSWPASPPAGPAGRTGASRSRSSRPACRPAG